LDPKILSKTSVIERDERLNRLWVSSRACLDS
jgi:hypothetical protein